MSEKAISYGLIAALAVAGLIFCGILAGTLVLD